MPELFTLTAEEWPQTIRMAGEYSWLNNDHLLPNAITYCGREFSTVEAAYKFAKYDPSAVGNADFFDVCTHRNTSGKEVRDVEYELREQLKIAEHFQETRFDIMLLLNRCKYAANVDLSHELIATYPRKIVEVTHMRDRAGRIWNDRFWGVAVPDGGNVTQAVGFNNMGRIAMRIRDELIWAMDEI